MCMCCDTAALVKHPSLASDVHVSWLETVLPKRSGSLVLVVQGKHRGKVSKADVALE